MNSPAKQPAGSGIKVITTNRKAQRDYHVMEKVEAGIALQGTEVKSIRQGSLTLNEGYARLDKTGDVILYGVHINPYDHGNIHNHEPVRPRRLLLHRREIKKLFGLTAIKGHALIPLRAYFRRGRVKIELGLCKGKQTTDKREDLKRKTADREAQRAMAHHNRR